MKRKQSREVDRKEEMIKQERRQKKEEIKEEKERGKTGG